MAKQTAKQISILIVEDDHNWHHSLRNMYEEILKNKCIVKIAKTVSEAEEMLSAEDYDLLSLDINLGDNITPDSNGFKPQANGLDLLAKAARKNWVNGVIVISGILTDEKVRQIIHKDQIGAVITGLHSEVERFFPGFNLTLHKNPQLNEPNWYENNISEYKKTLTPQILNDLASPSYILDVSGAEYNVLKPKASISSKSLSGKKPTQLHDKFARFLYLLARKMRTKNDDGRVTGDELLEIFQSTKTSQIAIDSVKKELRNKFIDTDLLIEGTPKKGFSLNDSVIIKGVDAKFKETYILEFATGYDARDTAVKIGFHRNRKKCERSFTGDDAMFLLELANQANVESLAAKIVCKRFGHDISGADDKVILETARRLIADFSNRLCDHKLTIEPYKLICAASDGSGWILNDDYVQVKNSSSYIHRTGLDERKLSKSQSKKDPVIDIDDKIDAEDFLKKHENEFGKMHADWISNLLNGSSLHDIANDYNREPDEVEDEINSLKAKWKILAGEDGPVLPF